MRLKLGCLALCAFLHLPARAETPMEFIHEQIATHAGQSGAYALESGEEALITRAWLGDHAQTSIDVQYFIWSTDNIGILAAEALLRAAERGVRVRILVDDLLIDAPAKAMIALARHPNIDIRIYNPTGAGGKRILNSLVNFRGVNQRMHNKVFVADGLVAVTGGRNMAGEYYDYNHAYNFRDRDALLVGAVVKSMTESFEEFWRSELSVKVENLFSDVLVSNADIKQIYRGLHEYASSPKNFAPEVRAAIDGAPRAFPRLAKAMAWGTVEFISDRPGKNDARFTFGGGGLSSLALKHLLEGARERVVIQSPYLVVSAKAMDLFRRARARGVRIRINTNSLASTDNLPAFGGYLNQRHELLAMGLEIYEYKPDHGARKGSVSGLHAKTMVVDSNVVFIGTFNLDPRSENLNTEVGVIIHDGALARLVEAAIETDVKRGSSWNAATDAPDRYASFSKRSRVLFWQLTPIKPIL
jgi:Phosphatidylserine/phosphatidylglycerophosphate/cardiolipin synthases and related enzymes